MSRVPQFVWLGSRMLRHTACVLVVGIVIATAPAAEAQGLYLVELYTNADRSEQFVVLTFTGPPATLAGRQIVFLSGPPNDPTTQKNVYTFPDGRLDQAPATLLLATRALA